MLNKEPIATDPELRFNKLAAANPLLLFSPLEFSVSFISRRQLVWCPTKGNIYIHNNSVTVLENSIKTMTLGKLSLTVKQTHRHA